MEQRTERRRPHPKPYTGRGLGHLFEDFDAARTIPAEPPPPAPPVEPPDLVPYFTEQEVATARREGYEAGMAERRAMTLRAHDEAVAQALATVASSMEQANEAAERIAEEAAEGIAKLLLKSLAGVLPALCGRYGTEEVTAILQTLLPKLKTEPRVVVALHPDAADAIRCHLGGFAHDLVDHVDLVPTPSIEGGDVRITWENGEAVRDTAQLWREVAGVLASFGWLDPQHMQLAPKASPAQMTPAVITATAVSLTRENADVE
jgi:flagellar assembly protein FliH